MKSHHWICAGLLASVACAAPAQTPHTRPDPLNPNVAVPPPSYRSTLDAYVPAKEAAPTPDKVWVAANKEVGAAGSHGGHTQHDAGPAPVRGDAAPPAKSPEAAPIDHSKHQVAEGSK